MVTSAFRRKKQDGAGKKDKLEAEKKKMADKHVAMLPWRPSPVLLHGTNSSWTLKKIYTALQEEACFLGGQTLKEVHVEFCKLPELRN